MDCYFLCALRDFISYICWLFHLFFYLRKKMKKVLVVACATYSLVNLPQKMWKMHDIEQVCSCLSPFLLLMKCRQIQNLTWSWLTTSSLKEAWKVSLALFWGLLFLINRVIGQEKAEERGVCASLFLSLSSLSLFLPDPSFLHGAGWGGVTTYTQKHL